MRKIDNGMEEDVKLATSAFMLQIQANEFSPEVALVSLMQTAALVLTYAVINNGEPRCCIKDRAQKLVEWVQEHAETAYDEERRGTN